MTRERDVKLGDIDDVPVDEPRRRKASAPPPQGGNGGERGKGGGRTPPPRQAPPRSGGGNGGWIFLTLLLAVALAVACAYFYREITALQGQMDEKKVQKERVRMENDQFGIDYQQHLDQQAQQRGRVIFFLVLELKVAARPTNPPRLERPRAERPQGPAAGPGKHLHGPNDRRSGEQKSLPEEQRNF